MKAKVIRPEVEILWLATVDEGKKLELSAEVGEITHALAMIVADESDESLWFQLYVEDTVVQIPLATMKKFLQAGQDIVHSEKWYEKNVPDYDDPGLTGEAKAFLKGSE